MGQIVGRYSDANGSHGFLYSNGTYTTLDDPLAANGTQAFGINDSGQIVGYYSDASFTEHGFLLTTAANPAPPAGMPTVPRKAAPVMLLLAMS
jgi:probable HAF family extracellular repeat protein